MRFLADEDVAIEAARCLRQAGHEVLLVPEVLGVRTDDVDIWRHAVQTQSIVVTCNRQDFLELAGTEAATGLIVLNRRRTRQAECRHLLQLLANAGEGGLIGEHQFCLKGKTPVAVRVQELAIAEPTASIREAAEPTVQRLIELTSRQQQTQRTLLDWPRSKKLKH